VAQEFAGETPDKIGAGEDEIVNVEELDSKQLAQSQIHNVKVE
jgi:hypothetical protein